MLEEENLHRPGGARETPQRIPSPRLPFRLKCARWSWMERFLSPEGVARWPHAPPRPKQCWPVSMPREFCTSLIKLIEQGPEHQLVCGWDITRFPLILGDEG